MIASMLFEILRCLLFDLKSRRKPSFWAYNECWTLSQQEGRKAGKADQIRKQ